MDPGVKSAETKRIFNGLWNDKDYVHTKKMAEESANEHAPLLTNVATAVDIRCCGSLGTRSVCKQIQALFHFAIGNQKLRINANTLVPSTVALVVSALVGSGKSLYHTLFDEVIGLLREATKVLDKQIHDSKDVDEEKDGIHVDSNDLSRMLSGVMDEKSRKQSFRCRQMLRNPGTTEG